MKTERSWWDGPWPWLIYLPTFAIPWIWIPPSALQLVLSMILVAAFLLTYIISFNLRGRTLWFAVIGMVGLTFAAIPIGGGWTALTVYPTMQAARFRPMRLAVVAIIAMIMAFLLAGFLSGNPIMWWLPGLLMPVLLSGAALSREVFYERTFALLATQEEVRRLAGLAERERMARDLHDTIGRTLTLVALKADLVSRLASRSADDAINEAKLIASEARTGLEQLGTALAGHIGGSLEKEIGDSLKALAAVGIVAEQVGDPTTIPADVGALLAMTLREAVTNVIRHANATRCGIGIAIGGDAVRLTVTDDGVGGPIEAGNGLTGMRQRLFAAGGRMSIRPEGRGLTIEATVPI